MFFNSASTSLSIVNVFVKYDLSTIFAQFMVCERYAFAYFLFGDELLSVSLHWYTCCRSAMMDRRFICSMSFQFRAFSMLNFIVDRSCERPYYTETRTEIKEAFQATRPEQGRTGIFEPVQSLSKLITNSGEPS